MAGDLSTVCCHGCSEKGGCVHNTDDALGIARLCVTLFLGKKNHT